MQHRAPWGATRLIAVVLALAGCVDDPDRLDEHTAALAGGWDGNRGGWDGNRGYWDGAGGGFGLAPPGGWDGNSGNWGAIPAAWAPEGTGPGTLSNPSLLGVELRPNDVASTPCGTLTYAVLSAQARSSRVVSGKLTGPDIRLSLRAGGQRWMAQGEQIVVRGRAHNGYLQYLEMTYRITRVTTYRHPRHPDVAWPGFHLEGCRDDDPAAGFHHLGVVTFVPFFSLPEEEGNAVHFHAGIVQPVALRYGTQPPALPVKFAAGAGLPVALGNESALDLAGCSSGTTVSNREFILAGALALGNASWVHPPGESRRFIAFFTRDGNPVAMFAQINGTAGSEQICLRPQLGLSTSLRPVSHLQLTSLELQPYNADKLDAVMTGNTNSLPATDREVMGPTHFGSGRSTYRRSTYAESSLHPDRDEFLGQLLSNIADAKLGTRTGAIWSPSELVQLLPGRASFVVAAESPVPEAEVHDPAPQPGVCGSGYCDVNETCSSCPTDCAVCDQPPPWEQPPTFGTDGGMPIDSGIPIDGASLDAGLPVDASIPVDSGGSGGG